MLNPLHLIFEFEVFSDTFTICHLFDQLKKHGFCLSISFGQMAVQLATKKAELCR